MNSLSDDRPGCPVPAPGADRLSAALWIAVTTGLLADSYFLIARAGWCVQSSAGLLWPLAAGVGLAAIVGLGLRAVCARDAAVVLLGVAGAAALLALAVLNLVPPIIRDELTYHLAFPALYLQAGRVYEIPFAIQSYYPMLLEMFYLPLLAHAGENAAKYLHLGYGLATGALVLLYLRPRVAAWAATFAAVLLWTTPTVGALGASAYVDLGLLFYATVGLLGVLRWAETGRRADFVAGALGAGCAASVKYNGVLVIAFLVCGVVLAAQDRGVRRALAAAAGFVAIALVPLLPWLIKNAWETGNPVFPLAQSLLGGPVLPERPSIGLFLARRGLYRENWLEVALTPVRVFVTGREGDPARFDGVFNPLYLLGLAAVAFPGMTRRTRLIAALAWVFLLVIFFLTVFRSRYPIVVLAPLAIVVAELMDQWRRAGRARAALAAVVAGALLFNAAHLVLFWQRVDPLAFLLGRQSRSEYLTRFVPEYPVVEYANAHLPREATVYLAFLGDRGYYWHARYSFDTHSPGITLRDAVRGAGDADGVAAALRRRGISHIAAIDSLLIDSMRRNLAPLDYQRWEQFTRTHLKPLVDHAGIGLYEIV